MKVKIKPNIKTKIFRVNKVNSIKMVNWNWMLPDLRFGYTGVDGLKTGHTTTAGYLLVATAKRNGIRLISVIMKARSRHECFQETKKLLNYGYNNFILKNEKFKVRNLKKKGINLNLFISYNNSPSIKRKKGNSYTDILSLKPTIVLY